jgi:hypothetical protein
MEENEVVSEQDFDAIGGVVSQDDAVLGASVVKPLEMRFNPQEDITAYELAMCLPHLFYHTMPHQVDMTKSYFRNFLITDPNE